MSNYNTLKSAIADVVKQNGNNEITGELLQQALLSMINSLGAGYQFVGVATPSTNPGTPDQNVFYIASEVGTYANFDNLAVADNEVAIFKYNGTWAKETTGAATVAQLNQLGQEINGTLNYIEGKCIHSNGTEVPNIDYNSSIFVDVSSFTKLKYVVDSAPSDSQVRIVEYNENKEYVDSGGYNYNNVEFDKNANTKYVRLSYLKTETEPKIYGDGDVIWEEGYDGGIRNEVEQLQQDLQGQQGEIDEIKTDIDVLIENPTYIEGKYVLSNGVIVDDGDYSISTHIQVPTGAQKCKIVIQYGSQVRIVGYDSSNQYTEDWGALSGETERSFDIWTTDTKYYILSFLSSDNTAKVYLDGVLVWKKEIVSEYDVFKNKTEEDITNIKSQLTNDEKSLSYLSKHYITEDLPDYYFTDSYIQNKVAAIENYAKLCSANGDVFAFITDCHWYTGHNAKQSPKILNYLALNTNIPRMFNGGDVVLNEFSQPENVTQCRQAISLLNKVFGPDNNHYVMGNHEWQGDTDTNLLSYYFNMHNADHKGSAEGKWYYVDNYRNKTRYIVVDVFGPKGTMVAPPSEPSETPAYQEQIDWFTNEALDVESGWHIIIFAHSVVSLDISTDVCAIYNRAGNLALINAVDNYNGNGEIVCIIQGEHHRDRILYTNGGVPIILTNSDKYTTAEEQNVTRTVGTTSEQCMDIFCINYSTRTMNIVRVGCKARNGIGNNPGIEVEERTVTWGNSQ